MRKILNFARDFFADLGRAWSQFWFQSSPTSPLEIARIGIGAALLVNYGAASAYLFDFWGEGGFVPRALVLDDRTNDWIQSVFFYFTAPWQWIAFHVLFLICCAALMLGWRTSWVKWIVLIGHISYAYRNPIIAYGVDKILACLLLILCVAPIGRAISLDRVRAVRAAKRKNLAAAPPPYASPWAGACIRLMQIQMAAVFFYSAVGKLRGDDWWDGDAIWVVFTTGDHYNRLVLDLLASHYWLVNVGTYGTILIEIAFPFLIWQRRTRPYFLVLALLLHLQFAVLMGLFYFSFAMAMGHTSFVRPEWLARLGAAWKHRIGDMEMIYDGRCGFCVRSMAWFLAFDGLGQIRIRDFRTDPSPVVSDAQLEKALYLVLPDGRALPGFEAYRYAVLRVPGLWWQVPFFYVPVLSRAFGHPIYNWVAANRSRLSSLRMGLATR
jgi:predicted DCC family thiol-disulfide oxidoreductase YuxK